jgi:hypothetical protein
MDRKWNAGIDSKGAMRSGNAGLRSLLAKAATALKHEEWENVAAIYNEMTSLASSLAESARINSERVDAEMLAGKVFEYEIYTR